MKKRLFSVIAAICAFLMTISVLPGCNLVATNSERDMAQVVATVKISDDAPKDEIIKKDMVMAYLNYGYYYVQNGYTASQVFEMIIDNLINSRIMLQYAVNDLDADAKAYKRDGKEKWDVERYLEDDDIVDATYDTIKAMNDLIDSYENTEDEKKYETYSGTERTVPTDATVDDELTTEEKKAYNEKYKENGADIGEVGTDRYKAYNKVLKLLKDNELYGDSSVAKLKDTIYYKNTLKSNEESETIAKVDSKIEQQIRSTVQYSKLVSEYGEMYVAQTNSIKDSASFSDALSNATETAPVVYTPYTGYTYVYNLLLGANEYQLARITEINNDKNLSDDEKINSRNEVLASITVTDQREQWIHAGYTFDSNTKKFGGDYAFLEDSIPFQGDITVYNEKTEKEDAHYRVDSIETFLLDDFIDEFVDNYVYGSTQTGEDLTSYDKYIYRVVNSSASQDLYEKRINELLFAFSTDSGSLNGGKGYLVAPKADIGGTETYVKEFANAGRLFVEKGLGDKSYIIVATDYGYHIMFFSKALGANTNFPTLESYLDSEMDKGTFATWEDFFKDLRDNWKDRDSLSDTYLYKFTELYANVDTKVSEKEQEILATYKNNSNCVVKYESRYSDLLNM